MLSDSRGWHVSTMVSQMLKVSDLSEVLVSQLWSQSFIGGYTIIF